MDNIKLTGNSKLLKKTKSKLNPRELALGLAELTDCGAGINPIKGYISLPNFDPLTGNITGYYGLYIVDGEIVIDTIEDVKSQINDYCNGIVPPPIL